MPTQTPLTTSVGMLLIALPVASVVAMAVTTVIMLPVIVGVIVTLMTEMLHAP